MNRNILALIVGLFVAAAGCSLAPQYSRPTAPVPATWPTGPAYASAGAKAGISEVAQLKWQEFFSDEKLQRVIAMALQNNRDLRLAALNVEQARALYGIQRAELFPVVNAVASATKERVPADFSGTGKGTTITQYAVNAGFTAWEMDFFGRIRSLSDAALQQYFATEQGRRSAQILLVSEVATAYLSLAADRETLKLAATTLDSQQAAYDLVKHRVDGGIATDLDLYRAQTQVDAARADLAQFTQAVAQDENALTLLVGSPVPADLLPAELGSVSPLKDISACVSSEVLLGRPDVLQAEELLKASNADIGAARAAFFPTISLTTSVGAGSDELSGLFEHGSGAWLFAPQVSVPIFDPRIWSAWKLTKVQKEAAIAQYEKAIQTAFREVADALAVQGTIDQQLAAQEALVHAASETYRLSMARYTRGVDSYLSVLDAQQSLFTAQEALIGLRLERLSNQARLYAALGGGWRS